MEIDSYVIDGEFRIEEVGQTRTGRILKIIFVVRADKVRILSAYDAPPNLKTRYLKYMVSQ